MEKNFGGFEPSSPRQRGRRKSKSNDWAKMKKKKKTPQRGMGVAQLERLRLEESWANVARNNTLFESLSPYTTHYFFPTNGFGQWGPNQALSLQRLGNGRFLGPVGSDPIRMDPYGFGALNPVETSGELSSMPNMRFFPDHCGRCHKKRASGENLGCGVRDKNADLTPINGCDFLGFKLGNMPNIDGENGDFGMRGPSHAASNVNKEAEVVGAQRKNLEGGGVFKEYEFFPIRKCGRSTCSKDLDLGFSEASCLTTTTTAAFDASNSVDLSLKLSC